jgi:hypothetical protein
MSLRNSARAACIGRFAVGAALVLWSTGLVGAQQSTPRRGDQPSISEELFTFDADQLRTEFRAGLAQAAVRLPLAALLGAALALRPRRASSPPRDPAVIETQIVLAIVGALIMIIVGASLARAFGIAGAANLIRYRAKIEDPKDAVVMLSTLALGLAAGVGLYGIGLAATIFLVATLWIIEGFETRVRTFLLTVKLGERTSARRADVERLLRRAGTVFELRTTGDAELSFLVNAGSALKTERLTAALAGLAPDGKAQIEWKDERNVHPLPEKDDSE